MAAAADGLSGPLSVTDNRAPSRQELLIEIGVEELPAPQLQALAQGFADGIRNGLEAERLQAEHCHWYATPRRLAVRLQGLPSRQDDQQRQRLGPTLDKALDADGKPTPAALGFARSLGVPWEQLDSCTDGSRKRLRYQLTHPGQSTAALLPAIIQHTLERLGSGRRMRWGRAAHHFVRPVRWLLILLDDTVVDCEIMGCRAARLSRGHRFHHPQTLSLKHSADYCEALGAARVQVDYGARRRQIQHSVQALARTFGGQALIDPGLLDEVTALSEWPVVLAGQFDPDFLALPREVLIATLQEQQRYFPVEQGETLLARFIFVSNIEAQRPERVIHGNERVVQPRLEDARFFYQRDRARPLGERGSELQEVLWQENLGTLHDRTLRIQAIITTLAEALGEDVAACRRSALLAKCDLVTDTVAEFPGLQGVVGGHLAREHGETEYVASAIAEQYLPRFSGDRLPRGRGGQLLAVAERTDHLLGQCLNDRMPRGDRDPYAMRRAALGLVRILIDCQLDIDLRVLISTAMKQFPVPVQNEERAHALLLFIRERLRTWCLEDGSPADSLEAVLAVQADHPLDCYRRLQAVEQFRRLAATRALAAANKRIRNILKQAGRHEADQRENLQAHDPALLQEAAERALAEKLLSCQKQLGALLKRPDYPGALDCLATLRESIDTFFDQVLVLCEEQALRSNRLILLQEIQNLFLSVADISRLSGDSPGGREKAGS